MNNKLDGCYSHKTDDWKTPSNLYNYFVENGYIDCFKYRSKENELLNHYSNEKLFINPPYSKMAEILKWLIEQIQNNKVVLLIPARTDTKYFHELLLFNPKIYFIKGRLHFNDSKRVAPFPSILMEFDHHGSRNYTSLKIK